jgi:hypothetical protein
MTARQLTLTKLVGSKRTTRKAHQQRTVASKITHTLHTFTFTNT